MKKLLIDVGHSKRFSGAVGIKSEVEWNRAILKALLPILDRKKWEVVLVPTDFLTDWSSNRQLVNRIKWINKRSKPSDWLLSIHGNAASNPFARGITTCYCGGYEEAKQEAAVLSVTVSKESGIPVWNGGAFDDRSARFGRIGMVRDTTPFALLIEAGFVTNREDMSIASEKVAQGIAKFFNGVAV